MSISKFPRGFYAISLHFTIRISHSIARRFGLVSGAVITITQLVIYWQAQGYHVIIVIFCSLGLFLLCDLDIEFHALC